MSGGNSSSSSSSDSSEDEDECPTLAQLTRKKDMVPPSGTFNEDIQKDNTERARLASSEYEEEDSEEEELQIPRELEDVLAEEVVPSKLNDVWKGGKIMKFVDEDGVKKWTCAFCGEVRKGWNATKALGHMLGGAQNVKGCEKIPSQWKQLYYDIVKRKKLSKQDKQDHWNKLTMSLNNKEAEALRYVLAEKEVSRSRRFSGPMHDSILTNSVDLTDSVDEDLSTLTSCILNSTKMTTPKKAGDVAVFLCVMLYFGKDNIHSSILF